MKWTRFLGVALGLFLIVAANEGIVMADTSSSASYKVTETFFGSGGELNACSASYCSKQAAGEMGVGNTSSAGYQAQAGFNTTDVPFLEVSVAGGTFDLGVQSDTVTSSAQTTVNVRNYLSHGYVLQIHGTPPAQTTHTITAMSTLAAAAPGTEQFGINLRDNATPNVGAEPVQVPSSAYSFGTYAAGYDTVDQFKYVDGDTIAQSAKSSGETDYTISFIMNINKITPAGQYTTDLSVVAVSTF